MSRRGGGGGRERGRERRDQTTQIILQATLSDEKKSDFSDKKNLAVMCLCIYIGKW